MNYEQLSDLNKEFAEEAAQMNQEFSELFSKWLKKSPRTAMVCAIHLPANILFNLILNDEENILPKCVPELPQIFMRFAYPFAKIKEHWGKASGKAFMELYEHEYEKLFKDWFVSDEQKENFKNWFEADTKKHKKGKKK